VSVYDHPDWAGFVAAIRADPADDTVRLIAADWLEEYDPERAEFIRTHLAYYAARHNHRHQSFGGEPCRKCKLKRRLKKLWHLPGKGLPSGIWGRLPAGGFLTTVDCSAAAWPRHCGRLGTYLTWIRGIGLDASNSADRTTRSTAEPSISGWPLRAFGTLFSSANRGRDRRPRCDRDPSAHGPTRTRLSFPDATKVGTWLAEKIVAR
jgi:uncharacterized protein (TIGR02996 family)